jgi:hypothetical protein
MFRTFLLGPSLGLGLVGPGLGLGLVSSGLGLGFGHVGIWSRLTSLSIHSIGMSIFQ